MTSVNESDGAVVFLFFMATGVALHNYLPLLTQGTPSFIKKETAQRAVILLSAMPTHQLHSELCTLHSAQRFQRCAKKYCACNKIFSILNFEFNGNLDSRALQKPKYGRCKTCIVIPTVSRFDSGWCAFNNSFFAPTFIHRRFFWWYIDVFFIPDNEFSPNPDDGMGCCVQ